MSALVLNQSSAVSTTYDVHEEFKAKNRIPKTQSASVGSEVSMMFSIEKDG